MTRAQRARIRTKATAAGQTLHEYLLDSTCGRISREGLPVPAVKHEDWRTADGAGWKRLWRNLKPGEKRTMKAEAAAHGVKPLEMCLAIVRGELTGKPVVRLAAPQASPETLRVPLQPDAAERLRKAAKAAGHSPQAHAAALLAAAPVAAPAGLIIRPEHAKALAKSAGLLEVDPQQFVDWLHEDEIRNLTEKGGIILDWADSLLIYKSKAERARVMKNVQPFRFRGDTARRRRELAAEDKADGKAVKS